MRGGEAVQGYGAADALGDGGVVGAIQRQLDHGGDVGVNVLRDL